MSVILIMLTLCACSSTKDEPPIQKVDLSALKPLTDAGIITGIDDITVEKDTDVNLKDLVFVDNNIIKEVTIDDSAVDYNTTGQYTATYDFIIDNKALYTESFYVSPDDITHKPDGSETVTIPDDITTPVNYGWDTSGDTSHISVDTTVTVVEITEDTPADENIITNETIDKIAEENKESATGNVKPAVNIETTTKSADKTTTTKQTTTKSSGSQTTKPSQTTTKKTETTTRKPATTQPSTTKPTTTKPATTKHQHSWTDVYKTEPVYEEVQAFYCGSCGLECVQAAKKYGLTTHKFHTMHCRQMGYTDDNTNVPACTVCTDGMSSLTSGDSLGKPNFITIQTGTKKVKDYRKCSTCGAKEYY